MTNTLFRALELRYPAPAWALFSEVGRQTGYARNEKMRWADAIAMSLYPSRGLDVHGHEIKVGRGDWLQELKDPAKAEPVAAYTDFWWIVAPSVEVVKVDEVPKNWGLMLMRGESLVVKKQAVRLEAKPLDRPFLAAILRRAHDIYVAPKVAASDEALRAAKGRGFDEGAESQKYETELVKKELRKFKEAFAEFEAKSGIHVNYWDAGQVGEAVARFRNPRSMEALPDLLDAAAALKHCHDELIQRADALRALAKSRAEGQ